MKGRVKWFKPYKGYGFIGTEDNKDFFVHYSNIVDDTSSFKKLNSDDIVEFDIIENERGSQASNVRIIERAPKNRRLKPNWYERRSF